MSTKRTNSLRNTDNISKIMQIADAFKHSKVLLTAFELDIFSIIGNERKTSKAIAHELDADERSTEKLLNALVALNLLYKIELEYTNTDESRWFLVKESPHYISELSQYKQKWDDYTKLTDAIKGGHFDDLPSINEKEDEEVSSCITMMHASGKKVASSICNLIDFSGIDKVMDLGGGSGIYSTEFLKTKDNLDITIFEQERIIPYTRQYLQKEGFADKIKIVNGDFLNDELEGRFDMVFLSNLFSRFTIWENINIAKKVFQVLRPGGKIIVHEKILEDSRIAPTEATLETLDLLLSTKGGEIYSQTDLWIVLKEAWFRTINYYDTEYGTKLVIADK